jgi:hypothetical protein
LRGVVHPHPKPEPRAKKPRKQLARSGPIARTTRLTTKTPIKAKNPERLAKRRAEQFPERPVVTPWCFIAQRLAAYQREHGPKMVPAGWSPCWGRIDPAHVVKTRGAGGTADDVVYLCRGHHREQEGRTAAFDRRYGVDLRAEAARLAAERRKAINDVEAVEVLPGGEDL